MGDENIFPGFRKPSKGYFSLPNEWTDITAEIDSLSELKVLEYTIRHTWGFERGYGTPKWITIDEFMNGRMKADGTRMDKGTKLSENAVKEGLRRAIKHGYITCNVNDNDKARIKKSYTVKMLEEPAESEGQHLTPEDQNVTPEGQDLMPEGRKLRGKKAESDPRSEKETSIDTFENNFGNGFTSPAMERMRRNKANCPDILEIRKQLNQRKRA